MVPSLLCIFVAHIIFLHVFFLPPFPSLSLSLSLPPPSFSLWLQDRCHLMPFTKYPLLNQSYFFTPYPSIAHIKFIHYSLFTDYLLRLPSSELLEKHIFSLSSQPSSSLFQATPKASETTGPSFRRSAAGQVPLCFNLAGLGG